MDEDKKFDERKYLLILSLGSELLTPIFDIHNPFIFGAFHTTLNLKIINVLTLLNFNSAKTET